MTDRFKERFDGATAWAALPEATKAEIGAVVLELVLAWRGSDGEERCETRPFDAMQRAFMPVLEGLAGNAIAASYFKEPLPVPSRLGPVCRRCGCSQYDACVDRTFVPCSWAAPDLCSACHDKAEGGDA